MALIHIQFSSKALAMQTDINVLMPNDIRKGEKLPVLYLLHGYMGNYSDWVRLTGLERYLFDKRLVVVMPSGYNGYYTDLSKPDQNYETYISKELPHYIESLFGLSQKKENRFIAGLSMGGFGALKIGLTNPNRYQKIGCFSGALDIDRYTAFEASRAPFFKSIFNGPVKNTKHDIYHLLNKVKSDEVELFVSCGTKDVFYPDALRLKTQLETSGFNHTYLELPFGHEWSFWDLSIEAFLKWL